jgi:hypothetical protein
MSSLIDETVQQDVSAMENTTLVPWSRHVNKMAPRVLVLRRQLFLEGWKEQQTGQW